MTPFTIYLNREKDAEGRLVAWNPGVGYVEGHELEKVYEGVVSEADLGLIFAMFNRGSGRFVGDERYPQRSLSVGDVVELGGTRYACDPVGWKELR